MPPSSRRELEMRDLSSKSKMTAARRSRRRRLKLGLAAALATMALVTPTALARPAGAGAGAGFAHLASEPSHRVDLSGDGSKADALVADPAPTRNAAAEGFDWGDAAVLVGAGMIVTALGFAAIGAYGGRRPRTA
jgi:hypothetical protein